MTRPPFDRLRGAAARGGAAIDRAFETLSSADSAYLAAVFYGVLFAYVARVVHEALGYAADARLFPLIVGSAMLGLIALKVVLLLVPDRYTPSFTGVFDSINAGFDRAGQGGDVDEPTRYRQEFVMILWVVGLVPLVRLFGFFVTLLVFVFAFVYVYERSLARAAAVTAAAAALTYVLFVVLLDVQLYRGVVRVPVPAGVVP